MKNLRATPLPCLISAVTFLLTPAAYAGYSYDFETPPPGTFLSKGLSNSGATSPTFSSAVVGGVFRVSDNTHPDAGGAIIGSALETGEVFTDVRASATLNPAGTTINSLNVLVRYGPVTRARYVSGVDFQAGTVGVAKVMNDRPVQLVLDTDPAQGSQRPLANLARSYYLQVDAVGNKVTARLFDSPGGAQLRVVNYTDTGIGGPALKSGYSGLSAVSFDDPRMHGTFDNFTSTALPEPGTAAFSAFVGIALIRRRHSRRPG
jgi:hypothetical protein